MLSVTHNILKFQQVTLFTYHIGRKHKKDLNKITLGEGMRKQALIYNDNGSLNCTTFYRAIFQYK